MINLFNINDYIIDTSTFKNHLHDKIINDFEQSFANYVGAKYACSINSATNAIYLLFLNKNITVNVPSMIPPVVLNALITSGNNIKFIDDVDWVGSSYILHNFGDYKIIDSAQRVDENQFKNEANDSDIMFFSFYPTKPVGGIDGGMIVSNDYKKIEWLKEAVMNGMTFSENNWERKIKFPGYKMYLNSVQAYIANENFKKLEEKKSKLKEIRNFYNKNFNLKNTSDHLYRILVNDNKSFLSYMKSKKIVCGIHYESQHENVIYTNEIHNCSKSKFLSNKTVSIPFHEKLSNQDLIYIVETIQSYCEQ